MTKREENKIFRETLHERFFWTYSTGLKNYLTENGHKFLFRCTHFKRNNFFWLYDKTEELLQDVRKYWENKERVSDTDTKEDKLTNE